MREFLQQNPWQSNEERLTSEALQAAYTPAEILAQVRPPLQQIQLFPPRYGYGDASSRVPTIMDVLDVFRQVPDKRTSLSGGPAGWQASARNVQGSGY